MSVWSEEFAHIAEAELGTIYQAKWWSQKFAETHPDLTFLMQVLNRHVVSPSKGYADKLRQHIHESDKTASYALHDRGPLDGPTYLARLAFTALALEERAVGLRFTMSAVMTAEDRRDLTLLLSGVNDDRACINSDSKSF